MRFWEVYLLAINTLLLLVVITQRQLKLSTLKNVEIRIMGVQQDLETLTSKFDSMEEAVNAVADDIAALKEEIVVLNEQTSVDLTPLIARAEGLEARLRAAAGSSAGSDDDEEEPPV